MAPVSTGPAQADLAAAITAMGKLFPSSDVVQTAYLALATRVRSGYVQAFKRIVAANSTTYPACYLPAPIKTQKVLIAATKVVGLAADLAGIVTNLWQDMQAARALAPALPGNWPPLVIGPLNFGRQSVNDARDYLSRAAAPFESYFTGYRQQVARDLWSLDAGAARLPAGAWRSVDFWYQYGLALLVLSTYAIQAVVAALPAADLYSAVDGGAGARLAAVKLGGCLQLAVGTRDPDCNVMSMKTSAGSLEALTGKLWSQLGLADYRSPADDAVGPYLQLAAQVTDMEIGDAQADGMRQRYRPDRLRVWTSSGQGGQVARHFPAGAAGEMIPFQPTFPTIAAAPNLFQPAARDTVLHGDPAAQLGMFVAALLYSRSGPFLVGVKEQPHGYPGTVSLNAGTLEFGGYHPPHKTHQSGVEFDLWPPMARKLANDGLPRYISKAEYDLSGVGELPYDEAKFVLHKLWNSWLQEAMNAPKITDKQPFEAFRGTPFDHYGTDPGYLGERKVDEPITVAAARAFTLSLWLSGATRILFADPWVFIDAFHLLSRTRDAVPKVSFGWLDSAVAFLEPYQHFNHWHGEWYRYRNANQRRKHSPPPFQGPDLPTFAPLWRALGIQADDLLGFLSVLRQGCSAGPKLTVEKVMASVRSAWDRTADPGIDLYSKLFDGPNTGDRWLLDNTDHSAEP